jgi:hypothetical protein
MANKITEIIVKFDNAITEKEMNESLESLELFKAKGDVSTDAMIAFAETTASGEAWIFNEEQNIKFGREKFATEVQINGEGITELLNIKKWLGW